MQLAALHFDALQVLDPVQECHGRQIAQLLGDPKPHIRRPGDQRGVGVGQIPLCQCVTVARAESAGGAAPGPPGYLGRKESAVSFHPVWDLSAFSRLGRADDRRIASAAAEIPCQLVIMVPRAVQMRHRHRDHKPRRAKAALAAMMLNHGGLDRVHFTGWTRNSFNGAHSLTVQLRQEQDAGIQCFWALGVGHHHCARAAVALIAAFLGAAQTPLLAQPIKQRPGRGAALNPNRRSVQQKRYSHPSTRRGLPG